MIQRNRRNLLILMTVFAIGYAGLLFLIHDRIDEYAFGEAEKQAIDVLLVHRAIHSYITRTQRPEMYRLASEGLLYKDYFSPELMSFTFIARNIRDLINEQRKKHDLEPIYFKLATDNPRNPINRADPIESKLLARMNAGELSEHRELLTVDGKRYLYLALPIDRSTPGCLRCHGEPKDAPADMVKTYGTEDGYYESADAIRALISIRVPFEPVDKAANEIFHVLAAAILAVTAVIYLLIVYFMTRMDAQQRTILSKNAELEVLSVTDHLTGILNRLGFQLRLQDAITQAARYDHPVSLILFDLDHFKHINDRYGHLVGDQVLKALANRIRARLRASDTLGRWGGEEFAVIAPMQGLAEASALAKDLCQTAAAEPLVDGIQVTISLGVSQYRAGDDTTALVGRADQAMYEAKEGGRNRVVALP